jgi:predicted enzyme related to lactoylglutathione lyase
MRLHGLEIPVSDIDRAFDFYANVLEFPIVGRFGKDSALFFLGDVHGGMASLVRTERPPEVHGPRLIFTAEGGVDEARRRLEAKGVTFLGPTDHGPLGLTAHFLDSEGNRLALFENVVTSRFREQARAGNDELVKQVAHLEARLTATLLGMSEAQAASRPAAGEWAVLGHLAHIVDTLDNCGVVAHDLANGRPPPRDRLWDREYAVDSLASARVDLQRAFVDARHWVAQLPGAPATETLAHGVFGPLNDREWVAFMQFHVGMHIGQIDAIKAGPGYPGA